MHEDLFLKKYSIIVIDEAHERRVNTDILIGVLSRVVSIRAKKSKEELEKILELKKTSND